jgi:hypothetical protein
MAPTGRRTSRRTSMILHCCIIISSVTKSGDSDAESLLALMHIMPATFTFVIYFLLFLHKAVRFSFLLFLGQTHICQAILLQFLFRMPPRFSRPLSRHRRHLLYRGRPCSNNSPSPRCRARFCPLNRSHPGTSL